MHSSNILTTAVVLTVMALFAPQASAGIVITPVFANQVVEKAGGDCAWGVVTPQGCAPLRG